MDDQSSKGGKRIVWAYYCPHTKNDEPPYKYHTCYDVVQGESESIVYLIKCESFGSLQPVTIYQIDTSKQFVSYPLDLPADSNKWFDTPKLLSMHDPSPENGWPPGLNRVYTIGRVRAIRQMNEILILLENIDMQENYGFFLSYNITHNEWKQIPLTLPKKEFIR